MHLPSERIETMEVKKKTNQRLKKAEELDKKFDRDLKSCMRCKYFWGNCFEHRIFAGDDDNKTIKEYFIPYRPNILINVVKNRILKQRLELAGRLERTFDDFVEEHNLQNEDYIASIPENGNWYVNDTSGLQTPNWQNDTYRAIAAVYSQAFADLEAGRTLLKSPNAAGAEYIKATALFEKARAGFSTVKAEAMKATQNSPNEKRRVVARRKFLLYRIRQKKMLPHGSR